MAGGPTGGEQTTITPTIAVIGAGNMGRMIAYSTALAGYPTVLEDILPSALRRAQEELRDSLQEAVRAGKCSSADAGAAVERLTFAGTIEDAVRQVDLVIEVVPDELESKLEIFTLLDKICRPATILVTTSMVFTPDEITDVTYRPERCVGMRFSPAHHLQKLEIVRGAKTDKNTMDIVVAVAREMRRKSGLSIVLPEGTSELEGATRL